MMRVGWIADDPGYVGGAELTEAEFAAAAPDGVEIVRVRGGEPWPVDIDAWVVHNCVQYDAAMLAHLAGKRVVKYVHDVWPHGDRDVRQWLLANAVLVFTSPLHLDAFPYPLPSGAVAYVVPPPMDLDAFREAKEWRESPHTGERYHRALLLAHHGKGLDAAESWATVTGIAVDAYGVGTPGGPVHPKMVPRLMAKYQHFVHMPDDAEPFGRTVVEAMVAGCEVHTNDNVGAAHWIANAPRYLEPGRAAAAFWGVVFPGVTAVGR